jgi:hypothetical protein
MEAASSSKTPVMNYKTAWNDIPEDSNPEIGNDLERRICVLF